MTLLSLCSGIGGLDRGLHALGYRTAAFAEVDPYASRVLARHYPDTPNLGDLRDIGRAGDLGTLGVLSSIDAVCAGFPCPPVSQAGKRLGTADPRWLWPQVARVVRDVNPAEVFIENVAGLLTGNAGGAFREVIGDLVALGYGVRWVVVSASAVGAPHRRERVWIYAARGLDPGRGFPLPLSGPRGWPRAGWASGRGWGLEDEWTTRVSDDHVLPTPRCSDGNGAREWDGKRGMSLVEVADRRPTPNAAGGTGYMSGANRDTWRPTLESAVRGMVPTPQAGPGRNRTALRDGSKGGEGRGNTGTTLEDFVTLWPTPSHEDVDSWLARRERTKERTGNGNGFGVPLDMAVRLWPTPSATDIKGSSQHGQRRGQLTEATEPGSGGKLNPRWVEWLMGFPLGWTEPTGPSLVDDDPAPWSAEPCPRVTTERENRRPRLRCLGNAVVPAQATAAFAMLTDAHPTRTRSPASPLTLE